jgi:MFS family permease
MGIALLLAVLTYLGKITIWQIYLLSALQAGAMAFDIPARQAMIPSLVPARDIPNAFSLSSIVANVGAITGPALSGVIIATLGQEYTYLFNAMSFLVIMLALLLIGPVQQAGARSGINLSAVKDGIRFILSKPVIFSTMLIDFVATFFASATTMLPIIAKDILKVGELGYGWLASSQAIGSLTAGLIISQVKELRRQGLVFLLAVFIFGAATIAFGAAGTFAISVAALIVMGAADTVSTIIRNTIRQLNTPDQIRGRMVALNQLFFQGGPQLGEVEAGIVATLLGVPFAIISGGIACIIGTGLIVIKWPQLRSYNGDEHLLVDTISN